MAHLCQSPHLLSRIGWIGGRNTRRFAKRVIDINRFQNGCGVNGAANNNNCGCGCKCFYPCGIGCGTITYVGPTGPTGNVKMRQW